MRSANIMALVSLDCGWYVPRQAESIPMFRAMFVLSALDNGILVNILELSILRPCSFVIGYPSAVIIHCNASSSFATHLLGELTSYSAQLPIATRG